MKDIEKIIADLHAWVEEDKENRAIALVAVQKTEDKEESYSCEQHTVTHGIMGYFCVDSKDSTPEHLVFNRAVALKDSFKK